MSNAPLVLAAFTPAVARAAAAGLAIWAEHDKSGNPAWDIATDNSQFQPVGSAEVAEAIARLQAAARIASSKPTPANALNLAREHLEVALSLVAAAHEDVERPAEYEDLLKGIGDMVDEIDTVVETT